jgi:ADP-ribose pyrophosphatase YjhB (NUDIX family)
MATPRVAAGVLFQDGAGAVLLVKPTYKSGWDLPGGYVEPGESPKQAAQREVREELGFEAEIGKLVVVDWAPHPQEGDKLLFVFEGASVPADVRSAAPEEIERVHFWPAGELSEALPQRLYARITSALSGDGVYLEHGVVAEAVGRGPD